MANALHADDEVTAYGGGQGPGASRFVCAGGFPLDEVAPTCEGLSLVVEESQVLPKNEFLRLAKTVMDTVWAQPLPSNENFRPSLKGIPDLLMALERGWAFNANEADVLYYVFGDVRPIERNGQIVGVGTQAPDGAFIHDGRELVSWRDRRWGSIRGPDHLKVRAEQQPLRIVGVR